MIKLVQRFFSKEIVRYLLFGGLTVLVNLACFYLFTEVFFWNLDISNIISVVIALLFAYVTNTRFVFRSKCNSKKERLSEFVRFIVARIFTMFLEIFGVHCMVAILSLHALVSKCIMQIIVITLNYVFSKRIIAPKRI